MLTRPRAVPPSPLVRAARRRRAGFTLLELLTVLAVVSVLLGLGVGFLQRGSSDLDLALAVVRDQVRVAANTAVSNGLPTAVHIAPAQDGEPVRLHARVLTSVGYWHFEPGERWIHAGLRPELTGSQEPAGRFGEARRPDPASRQSLLTVAAGASDLFFFDDGFALRLELRLESHRAMSVAALGRAFELTLDDDLRPAGKVTLAAGGDRPGSAVTVRGQRPLSTGRWATLELVHDGSVLALLVDGREEAVARAGGAPVRRPDDLFEVSLGAAPVIGVVDEVQLLAYERGAEQALPFEVELRDLQGPVLFGRRGELLRPARFTLVLGEESLAREVAPGGVLMPWKPEVETDGRAPR